MPPVLVSALPLLFAAAAGLPVHPCSLDGSTEVHDVVHLGRVDVVPSALVPGSSACFEFDIRPSVPITTAWSLHVQHDLLGDLEFETCETSLPKRLPITAGAKCPTAPDRNVSGRVCVAVPLAAIIRAGEQTDLVLSWANEAGRPAGCYRVAVPIAGEVAVDETVEALAAEVRQRLHQALSEAQRANPKLATKSDSRAERRALDGIAPTSAPGDSLRQAVRPLLQQVYEAQPDWKDAFSTWQAAHRKVYRADEAEAAAFTAFRDNVMAAARSGQPLTLDERFDLSREARRTLSHFS